MRLGWGAWKASLFVAVCLIGTVPGVHAQKSSGSASADATRAGLALKARDLEARGRADLAVQIWQQILLSTPENAEALAGLARDYKLTGNEEKADAALARLRRVNPNDPNIAKIASMPTTSGSVEELRQAGDLAKQGRNDEAMRIYRQLYADHPPDGDIGLAYYRDALRHRQWQAGSHCRHAWPGRAQSRRSALSHSAGHHAHLRPAHAR